MVKKTPKVKHNVMEDVVDELALQVKKYGGIDHDDMNDPNYWTEQIRDRAIFANRTIYSDAVTYRRRMIQIAALAISGVESFDRKHG